MRFLVLSDLHNDSSKKANKQGRYEFVPDLEALNQCDALILAGDIDIKLNCVEWAARTFPNVPTFMVLGNHDLWGSFLPDAYEKAQKLAKGTNVTILQNSWVDFPKSSLRLWGATLWTDFRLCGNVPLAILDAENKLTGMKDMGKIRMAPDFRKMEGMDQIKEHALSLASLREARDTLPEGWKMAVVTHHAPSSGSVHDLYRQDDTNLSNAAYASNLEYDMGDPISLWIHGHTHHSFDYDVAGTRVVCNPRGYIPHYPNPDFNPGLILEVQHENKEEHCFGTEFNF